MSQGWIGQWFTAAVLPPLGCVNWAATQCSYIITLCHFVTLLLCYFGTLGTSLLLCYFATLGTSLLLCYFATLSTSLLLCYFVTLLLWVLLCYFVTLLLWVLLCYFATLPSRVLCKLSGAKRRPGEGMDQYLLLNNHYSKDPTKVALKWRKENM